MRSSKSPAQYVQIRTSKSAPISVYHIVDKRKDPSRAKVKQYKRVNIGIDMGQPNEPDERVTIKSKPESSQVNEDRSRSHRSKDLKASKLKKLQTSKTSSTETQSVTDGSTALSSLTSTLRRLRKTEDSHTVVAHANDHKLQKDTQAHQKRYPHKHAQARRHNKAPHHTNRAHVDRVSPQSHETTRDSNRHHTKRAQPFYASSRGATPSLEPRTPLSPQSQLGKHHALKMAGEESAEAEMVEQNIMSRSAVRREGTRSPFQQPSISAQQSHQLVFGATTRVSGGRGHKQHQVSLGGPLSQDLETGNGVGLDGC